VVLLPTPDAPAGSAAPSGAGVVSQPATVAPAAKSCGVRATVHAPAAQLQPRPQLQHPPQCQHPPLSQRQHPPQHLAAWTRMPLALVGAQLRASMAECLLFAPACAAGHQHRPQHQPLCRHQHPHQHQLWGRSVTGCPTTYTRECPSQPSQRRVQLPRPSQAPTQATQSTTSS